MDNAEALVKMQDELLSMLHDVGVPVSSAADGTETERKVQRLVASRAHTVVPFTINNNVPECILSLDLCCYHGVPCVQVQDSKHGAKTARNQLFTGARILAMGNFSLHWQMLRDFAEHALGPLFHRDVEHVDKQNDRAAARPPRPWTSNFTSTLISLPSPSIYSSWVNLSILGRPGDSDMLYELGWSCALGFYSWHGAHTSRSIRTTKRRSNSSHASLLTSSPYFATLFSNLSLRTVAIIWHTPSVASFH